MIAKGAFDPSFAGQDHQLAAEDALDQGDEETRAEGKGRRREQAKESILADHSQGAQLVTKITH